MMSLSEEAEAKLKQQKIRKLQLEQLKKDSSASCTNVIQQIKASDNKAIFVDFDETLWLRNSTEMFLANIRSSFLVLALIQLMNLLRPWLWLRHKDAEHYQELVRLKVILFFVPGAIKQWQQQATVLGPEYANRDLLNALKSKNNRNIYVVSYGFNFIIEPLLKAIDPSLNLVLASSFDNAVQLRKEGKAASLQRRFGETSIQESICITDSQLDLDLLEACGTGLFCKWPDAKSEAAGLSPMLPFVFTKTVNRPKEKYFTRVIIGHDYIGLVLSFALVSPNPVITAISLLMFVLAFFSIYETGYHENDKLGLVLEKNPRVSDEFLTYGDNFKPLFAWCCGLLMAVPAALIAAGYSSWIPDVIGVSGLDAVVLVWLTFVAFMLFVRTTFYWFNRTPVKGRLVPMLVLQFCRNCGYLVIFPTSVAGALFCLSWTLGKWFPYMIYRFGGSAMGYPNHLITALLMGCMMMVVGLSHEEGFGIFADWPSVIMIAYTLVRGGKDLWSFRSNLTPIRFANEHS